MVWISSFCAIVCFCVHQIQKCTGITCRSRRRSSSFWSHARRERGGTLQMLLSGCTKGGNTNTVSHVSALPCQSCIYSNHSRIAVLVPATANIVSPQSLFFIRFNFCVNKSCVLLFNEQEITGCATTSGCIFFSV